MGRKPKYRPMQRVEDTQAKAYDAIELWYETKGRTFLTILQHEMHNRWKHAYQLFIQDRDASFNRAVTIRKHANIWKQSEIQSRRDLDAAIELFAKMDSKDRKTHRAIAIEMAMKTFKKAEQLGELADMNKATKNYIEATGVDKEDPNIPKAEDFKLPVAEVADELTRLVMEKIAQAALKGNTIDLQNLKVIDLIEGIDYETVTNLITLPAAHDNNG